MNYLHNMWLGEMTAEERALQAKWQAAWSAYRGDFPPSLKVKEGRPDDNVAVNYARLVVDKGVAFLFGQPFNFELGGGVERTPDEAYLDEVVRRNGGALLWQKLAINGGVYGHVFLKIVPQADGFPRLVILMTEDVRTESDPDDIAIVLRYIIEYTVDTAGKEIRKRQTIERAVFGWQIIDEESSGYGRWERVNTTAWPYTWPPIVDTQNLPNPNEYYGVADIEEDVLGLNYAINFTLSNLQRIIRFHAHPKTWGQGFNAQTLNVAPDETIVLPGGATLQNLEMQSDLTSSIEYYLRLKEALHETAHVPEVATGKLDSTGQLSGVALAILYQPLLDRTEQKRHTYGALIVELFRRLLEMAGRGSDKLVVIHWPELLPENRMEAMQAAVLEKQIGVSQDTTLRRLGYDPDEERAKREVDGGDMAEQLLSAFDRGQ